MTRLLMLVEGQTEEAFVKAVLTPHLAGCGVYVEKPVLIPTKRNPSGKNFCGGVTSWGKIRNDLLRLLKDGNAWVTTLLDFYGLPSDFPNLERLKNKGSAYDKVDALQKRIAQELNGQRLIPFLALHEIEAWLFSAPDTVADHYGKDGIAAELHAIVKKSNGAELINDTKNTSPYARINKVVQQYTEKSYKKVSHGATILEKIGVESIRKTCPHFNAWLKRLEALGNEPA